jgi:hypothetical protein
MMGLRIKQTETMYMPASTRGTSNITYLGVVIYKFKCVESFTCLGSEGKTASNVSEETGRRTRSANRSYFGLQNRLNSRLLSEKTEIQLFKTLLRPIERYGAECWTLSHADKSLLNVFQRKILRRVYGTAFYRGVWRTRYQKELCELLRTAIVCSNSSKETAVGRACATWG